MSRPITWNFYKITLRSDSPFPQRQTELLKRFFNADTFVKKRRGTSYRYKLFDVTAINDDDGDIYAVTGYLTREPKTAHGRRLNESSRTSAPDSVNIDDIADASEFVYDLKSCVLALHRRAPFTGIASTADAWRMLLGVPPDPTVPSDVDIHAQALRDTEFADSVFDTGDPLREVKLVVAKPNPGSGDDILSDLHLGLIGEEINSDELTFDAKNKSSGGLDKKPNGFIRRSIRKLLGAGYVKRGFVRVGDRNHDLLDAKEKERTTDGYLQDQNGRDVALTTNAAYWLEQLARQNSDIYFAGDGEANHDQTEA